MHNDARFADNPLVCRRGAVTLHKSCPRLRRFRRGWVGEGEARVGPRAVLQRQPPLQREDEAAVGEGERDGGEHVTYRLESVTSQLPLPAT